LFLGVEAFATRKQVSVCFRLNTDLRATVTAYIPVFLWSAANAATSRPLQIIH